MVPARDGVDRGRRGTGPVSYQGRHWLRSVIVEIIEASCGEDGLALAPRTNPDVIFLDLILPDMTGFEILERLKSDVEPRKTSQSSSIVESP